MVRAVPILLLCMLVLALVTAAVQRVRVDDRDVAWLAGGPLPTSPAVAEVYRRYLRRHRTHRAVGGCLGALLPVAFGAAAQRDIPLGVAIGGLLQDMLFWGIAGVVAGALSAEVYRVTARPGPAVASLALRPVHAHGRTALLSRMLVLVALAVAAVHAVVAGPGPALGAVLAGTVVVGMAEAARRAIADRRRPVLSTTAAEVDLRIRNYASTAVAHLQLAAGALTVAWVLGVGQPPALPWLRTLVTALTVGLVVLAIVQLFRARPRPPGTFLAAVPGTGAVA